MMRIIINIPDEMAESFAKGHGWNTQENIDKFVGMQVLKIIQEDAMAEALISKTVPKLLEEASSGSNQK